MLTARRLQCFLSSGVTMTTAEEYVDAVQEAGFTVIEASDLHAPWAAFCAARAASWRAAADRHRRVPCGDNSFCRPCCLGSECYPTASSTGWPLWKMRSPPS
jgi:hypothetical protein